MKKIKLILRKIHGRIAMSQQVNKRYGKCGRCGRPWSICNGHNTNYTIDSGCFPLCEECWSELSVDERLPFYELLWNRWEKPEMNDIYWNSVLRNIKKAVLCGK